MTNNMKPQYFPENRPHDRPQFFTRTNHGVMNIWAPLHLRIYLIGRNIEYAFAIWIHNRNYSLQLMILSTGQEAVPSSVYIPNFKSLKSLSLKSCSNKLSTTNHKCEGESVGGRSKMFVTINYTISLFKDCCRFSGIRLYLKTRHDEKIAIRNAIFHEDCPIWLQL